MSTPLNTFAASPWRAEILSELLLVGEARPGLTLVVALDADPWELAGFARLRTPRPPEGDNADAVLSDLMSPRLSQLAYLFAPKVTGPLRRPTRELVTIICREGEPVPTPVEEQFATAWRLARDEAPISRGDVYVVTPQGWACLQGGSGDEARLEIKDDGHLPDDDVLEFPPFVDAEAFASDFARLAAPNPQECLACYVTRMVGQFGCDGTWRFVDHYRAEVAPRATALEQRPWRRDGECDCDVYELGYDLAEDVEEPVEYTESGGVPVALHHEWPWPNVAPACRGVHRGSVKPCSVWEPLRPGHG